MAGTTRRRQWLPRKNDDDDDDDVGAMSCFRGAGARRMRHKSKRDGRGEASEPSEVCGSRQAAARGEGQTKSVCVGRATKVHNYVASPSKTAGGESEPKVSLGYN